MKLVARNVSFEDADLILGWRNSIDARMMSRNSGHISATEHYQWLKTWLGKEKQGYFWVYSENNKDIGFVRFDATAGSNSFEVSIFIVQSSRGRGTGKMMLEDSLNKITILEKNFSVKATVLKSNLASLRLFISCGFKPTNSAALWEDLHLNVT